MAILTAYVQAAGGKGNPGTRMYMVEKTVDLTVETTDPSSDDVLQVLTIPANTMLMSAGLEVIESVTANTGTDVTVDLGTALDDDKYVAAFDVDGAAVGAYGTSAATAAPEMQGAAETLDMTFAGTGASFTSGKIRVFALLIDMASAGASKTANEVDRDTLA
jgi:hypothetical protein